MFWPCSAECKATGNHTAGKHSDKLKFDLLSTCKQGFNSLQKQGLRLNRSQAPIKCQLLFFLYCVVLLCVAGPEAEAPLPTFLKRHQQKQRGGCATVIHVIAHPCEATWLPDSFWELRPRRRKIVFFVVVFFFCRCCGELKYCAPLKMLFFIALWHLVVKAEVRLCLPLNNNNNGVQQFSTFVSCLCLFEAFTWPLRHWLGRKDGNLCCVSRYLSVHSCTC